MPVERLTHTNIGMAKNGLIGKVEVLKASGEKVFLNIYKYASFLKEIYFLKDNAEQVIGEIELRIKKAINYDKVAYPQDPSHVYVELLRNDSDPKTPFYRKGLEEYKNIGARLLQIAQRRSDEAQGNGNIELTSRTESFDFYNTRDFKNWDLSWGGNPYRLYLPPEAKEPLSKRYGGL
jgi:hypothetical protein